MNKLIIPLFLVIYFFMFSRCFAITPSRFIDTGIQFAIATVGGTPAYTQAEKDALIASPGGTVVTLTPTFYELAVSTTIPKFISYSDFASLLTTKQAAIDKILDIEGTLVAYLDLQSRYPGINITARVNRLKAEIDLLVSLVPSLP